MPSRKPISHTAVTGRLAQRTNASAMPTSPLARSQPQLGKVSDRQSKDDLRDTLHHEEDDKEQRDRQHPLRRITQEQKSHEHGEDDGGELEPEMRHVALDDQAEGLE